MFGFSEVRLGIIPGVISPMVLAKIGPAAARRYFLTGERFDARTAPGSDWSTRSPPTRTRRWRSVVDSILAGGLTAVREAKRLVLGPGEEEDLAGAGSRAADKRRRPGRAAGVFSTPAAASASTRRGIPTASELVSTTSGERDLGGLGVPLVSTSGPEVNFLKHVINSRV